MAFKKTSLAPSVPESPADLFRTFTRRTFQDVMPHQRDILRDYGDKMVDECDVALQLPTGSGKTLVGLLIAEWRRRKFEERVVYLCPTKQLVNQTVEQAQEKYGIDVNGFVGRWRDYPPTARSDYTTGAKTAITTYSSLFNTAPFFNNPDVIIIDDIHAAENYIAKMWSLEIPADDQKLTQLHAEISDCLRPHLTNQAYSRLTGNWTGPADANWVDKLSSIYLKRIAPKLTRIIDAHSNASTKVTFSWQVLRDHLDACHLYLSSREILIRPLIPPTWTHKPFANARQRLYMSATLGVGGDLERLTGTASITRLPAPENFRSTSVGRRFFIFPGLSLEPEDCNNLRLEMQKIAGRSVVLTTNNATVEAITEQVKVLGDFATYDAKDIEASTTPFIEEDQAVAIMAARFDGIDLPDEECRFLCLDGLPKATNAQERFLMTKMGATGLFNERLQTRVLQATGRCTRGLKDRSAVFVTGNGLCDFLADDRNWKHFHPELQAELAFGVLQSRNITATDLIEDFKSFLANNNDWAEANTQILDDAKSHAQELYPAMDNLEEAVKHEVLYQKALWMGDKQQAYQEARKIVSKLTAQELRGYRALWHYLAGAAARSMSTSENDDYQSIAREQFTEAMNAAPFVAWLAQLARDELLEETTGDAIPDQDIIAQVERLEEILLGMGTASDQRFEKKVRRILENINTSASFEEGQRELGELLGFIAGKVETDASPDPWWLGATRGIVFEAHADAKPETKISATKARQAASHLNWMNEHVPEASSLDINVILVTPCTEGHQGAKPSLNNVRYWSLDNFRKWAGKTISTIRELKGTLPPNSDMFWRDEAAVRLAEEGLTLSAIIANCPIAGEYMDFPEKQPKEHRPGNALSEAD